jgi:hypothetical protein
VPEKSKDPIDQPNYITARKTLRFLAKELRLHQFMLKAHEKKRKEYERFEAETRNKIGRLRERIQKELDMNPGIFNGIKGEED